MFSKATPVASSIRRKSPALNCLAQDSCFSLRSVSVLRFCRFTTSPSVGARTCSRCWPPGQCRCSRGSKEPRAPSAQHNTSAGTNAPTHCSSVHPAWLCRQGAGPATGRSRLTAQVPLTWTTSQTLAPKATRTPRSRAALSSTTCSSPIPIWQKSGLDPTPGKKIFAPRLTMSFIHHSQMCTRLIREQVIRFSTTVTSWPSRRNSMAWRRPTGPPPTTTQRWGRAAARWPSRWERLSSRRVHSRSARRPLPER
mmetsp:Transcript_59803/g.160098  ORF Transcript_59803/g.160098 Transcript_59803/m.160098 type:complete len:253 (-) Transcript_59803:146-904(-)